MLVVVFIHDRIESCFSKVNHERSSLFLAFACRAQMVEHFFGNKKVSGLNPNGYVTVKLGFTILGTLMLMLRMPISLSQKLSFTSVQLLLLLVLFCVL